MGHHSEAFIGIDTSRLRNAVAVLLNGGDSRVANNYAFTHSWSACILHRNYSPT